jgi:hypothetical protein
MPEEISESPRAELPKLTEPTWLGNPLEFHTWLEEDPAGTAIVFFAVVEAPDALRANWRKN